MGSRTYHINRNRGFEEVIGARAVDATDGVDGDQTGRATARCSESCDVSVPSLYNPWTAESSGRKEKAINPRYLL